LRTPHRARAEEQKTAKLGSPTREPGFAALIQL
jgi:hypothetical protein